MLMCIVRHLGGKERKEGNVLFNEALGGKDAKGISVNK